MIVIIILLFAIIMLQLFRVQVLASDKYKEEVSQTTEKVIEGQSAPRGRIYDRNHKLIVDNVTVKTIYYKKEKNVTTKEEIKLAYQVGTLIDVPFDDLADRNLREFWLANHPDEASKKISEAEYKQVEERKLTKDDLEKLKLERITPDELAVYTDTDKEAAKIYYLMNKGYYYDDKVIKNKDVSDDEYAAISSNSHNLKGFNTKLDWERKYLYGDTFRTILGNVSNSSQGIPTELKDEYVAKGYSLDDRVGISYLEYQYESILKGKKTKYKLVNGNYEVVDEGSRGDDIVLSIDIDLQLAVEQIITEEILKAKTEPNTEYYNRSFVIITEPNTGEILAMAGKQVQDKNGELQVYDYAPGITTSPVTVGSVVKGASMIVGYNAGVIDINSYKIDKCIKIKGTNEKCSWNRNGLGRLNDIRALELSSNSYQYQIAIDVAKGKYQYDKPLIIDTGAFDTYRNTYSQFGLGIKTGIDLPVESTGFKGSQTSPGLLLDFAIGQYDNYTPIQLSQYITTFASGGYRLKPQLLKEVYQADKKNLDKLVYQYQPQVLNRIDTDPKYLARVQEGFRAVMQGSLGRGYMGSAPNPAGKTGTSESFVDSDGDGKIDTETTTKTFAGYAPAEDPKMSIVTISPDISHPNGRSDYATNVNKLINSRVSDKFFEIYQ